MSYELKDISQIRPNPFIDEFYGGFSLQSYNDVLLFENIAEKGIKSPLIVTKSGLIISGNRRYYCAQFSNQINTIPVIIEDVEDDEVTEYMIVSLQIQRIKTEIQIAKEFQIIGNFYKIKKGKGNQEQNKEGRKKRDELMSNSNYSESTIKRVLTSHELIKNIDKKLDDDSAWKKLEDLYKSKSIDGVVTYLKNIEGEIKNESKSKEVILDKYESFKIYSRSCEDLSDIVKDKTIDCVCTSPPYYSGIRKYSEDGKEIKKGIKNKDLIQLGHEKTPEEYVEKMVKYVVECVRTLKNTGSIWVNIMDVRKKGNYFNAPEKLLLELEKIGLITAQKCIWFKTNPPYDNNDVFQPSMEYIYHFVINAKKYQWIDDWFDEADEFIGRVTYGGNDKKRKFKNVFIYPSNKNERNEIDGVGMVNSLIETNVINNSYLRKLLEKKGFHLQHNALYDLEIPMICILSTTKKGDSIMDVFSGLASTGLIAYCNQCEYIGIEQSGVYSAQSIIRFEDFIETNPYVIAHFK